MTSEWRTVQLSEVASEVTVGFVGTMATEYIDHGIPFLRSLNVDRFKINSSDIRYISRDFHSRISKSRLKPGDVVIVRTGKPGTCAVIPGELLESNCSDLVIVRCGSEIFNRFLCYYVNSAATNHIAAHLVGAVQQHFNVASAKTMEIPLPPIQEQKSIAHILGTLDDKIELNRKTNETLEAMAKALFKSWFVDFDPVKAKAEGRPTGLPAEISDLFPDSFEDSELGEIPSGWGTTCLDELTSFVIGGDWGKDVWSESEPAKVLCLRGADIPSLQEFAMGKPPTRFLRESSFHKRTLVDGDIVLEISGGSPDQSTGRPVLISPQLIKRAETPLACSNFCRLIRFDDLRWSSYAYYLVLSLYQSGEMFQYETGTTGIKNFGYKYFAGGRFFPKPPSALLDLFHCQVKSLHSSCHRRGEESDLLSKTRDALLPKLISGEIRIPDAEKMLEEVLS